MFAQFEEMCNAIKNKELGADNVIMVDLFVLGDTVEELHSNLDKFFNAGGNSIQLTDGTRIQRYCPVRVIN